MTFSIRRTLSYPSLHLRNAMHLKTYTIPRVQAPERLEVHLTKDEEKICDFLNECRSYLESEKNISTTCRIAGGWVRDKLLGHESNDIDVALSEMMGLAFAEHLSTFAEGKGISLGHIGKIAQNPDQSKHLETATLKVFDHDIDLVNLRSEAYAEGSRIPTEVTFGTPVQDALRRDITINALFYNIQTREVEDLTGKGIDDLREGKIRTPLQPRETFIDDPLRILRCIRFASRFGFDMVPEIREAILDPVIKQALISLVTRDRIGTEVEKMLQAAEPYRAVQNIFELQLYDAIFYVKNPQSIPPPPEESQKEALAASSILRSLLQPSEDSEVPQVHPLLITAAKENKGDLSRYYLAALLLPYNGQTYQDHKGKTQLVIDLMIREALKRGSQNHYLDGIPALYKAVPLIRGAVEENVKTPLDRVRLGLCLRHPVVHNLTTGSLWSGSIFFSLLLELAPVYNVAEDDLNVGAAETVINKYNDFVDKIVSLNLHTQVDFRPLLTGREVGAALDRQGNGPWVGKVLEDVIKWQLEFPEGSKDECTEWLKKRGPEYYNIPIQPTKKKPRMQ